MSTESPKKHFENEKLAAEVTFLAPSRAEVTVTLKPEWQKELREEAAQKVRKDVSLPGFRKGKAPLAFVLSKFSDAVERTWREELVNAALRQMGRLTQLPIVEVAIEEHLRVQVKHLTTVDVPAVIQYAFDLIPAVELVDLAAVEWTLPEKQKVSETEVIERLRAIDSWVPEERSENEELSEETPVAETSEESLEILLPKVASHLKMPPETLEANIRKMIESEHERAYAQNCEAAMRQAILTKFSFEMPESLINIAVHQYASLMRHRIAKHAGADEAFTESNAHEKEWKEEAIERLKLFHLAARYAKEHKIEITKEENTKELESLFSGWLRQDELPRELDFLRKIQIGDFTYATLLIRKFLQRCFALKPEAHEPGCSCPEHTHGDEKTHSS